MILVFNQNYQYWELNDLQMLKSFWEVVGEWQVVLVVVGGGGGVGKGLNDSSVQTERAIYDWIDTGTTGTK